jgi:hypothetical protein
MKRPPCRIARSTLFAAALLLAVLVASDALAQRPAQGDNGAYADWQKARAVLDHGYRTLCIRRR